MVRAAGRRTVEDDALGEALVMLEEEEDTLVEELLAQREAVLLLRAAKQDRALLDERRLVHEASGGLRLLSCGLRNQARAHLAPVEVFACGHPRVCAAQRCGDQQPERAGGEGEHSEWMLSQQSAARRRGGAGRVS